MIIDAHHHLWTYSAAEFGWVRRGSSIAKDFDAEMLMREMRTAGVDGAIAVQARQSDEETRFLVEVAQRTAAILGVVGWIDLRAQDLGERIEEQSSPLIVGYRHIVQDEPDPNFLLSQTFVRGVRTLVERDLTYDLLIGHHQLSSVPHFLERVGEGRFVLDHAAKPDIRNGGGTGWAQQLADIASFPNVSCKVSGLVTEADHACWTAADMEPYLEHIFELFGPHRLIWGSDWPVCLLASPYADVFNLISDFVERHCPEARDAVFAENAISAYAVSISAHSQVAPDRVEAP